MKNRLVLTALVALICGQVVAQIVTLDPTFATQSDVITITYDASQGNGGLSGVVPVYAHTGVILEGEEGWQNVQGNWGQADPNVLMTPLGNNLHELTIDIEDFYGIEDGEVVTQLAFVFRNATGSLEGKTADNSDIYVDLYNNEFATNISTPFETIIFTDDAGEVEFTAVSNIPADFNLYLDDAIVDSGSDVDELSTEVDFTGMATGQYWLWMEATNGALTQTDSTLVIIQGLPQVLATPTGVVDGINYIDDQTVILQIFAPFKEFIYVMGDFNDWQYNLDYFMNVTPEGNRFWIEVSELTPGQEYAFQYVIDDEAMRVADIYADKILDPWNDQWIPAETYPDLMSYPEDETSQIVSVLQTAQEPYVWQVESFERPATEELVIYELLVRDFDESHSYQAVIDRLPYLIELGVNAIQLMPFTEFEGNESWGYNPMFYFAPDKYYGTKNDLKAMVDACHQAGIAVIQDVVFNHSFGQNPQLRMYSESGGPAGPPSADSPYFNQEAYHPFNVGYDYNHDSPHTQAFMERNLKYWNQEYKIDGFRFDLSKGFTQNFTTGVGAWSQYDQSRINHWLRIRDEIHAYDEEAYIILEHFAENDEETVLANAGMMIWGNENHEFNEASMGYSSQFNWANYQTRGWNSPNLIAYAESHDEERLMYKNLEFGNSSAGYNVTELPTALARQEAIAAIFLTLPGPKMIWQFGELGYDYSINYCPNGTIEEGCRTANKPIRWDYLEDDNRLRLYKVYAALNKLRMENEAFTSDDYVWDVNGFGKRLIIQHPTMNVVVMANMDVNQISMVPGFTQTGTWYNYFTGESIIENDLNNAFLLEPGEYRIYTDVELETPDISVGIDDVLRPVVQNLQTFPNPFIESTRISFNLDKSQKVQISVLDLNGRVVKVLFDGDMSPGHQNVEWDGTSQGGASVASGIYVIRAIADDFSATAKVYFNQQ